MASIFSAEGRVRHPSGFHCLVNFVFKLVLSRKLHFETKLPSVGKYMTC